MTMTRLKTCPQGMQQRQPTRQFAPQDGQALVELLVAMLSMIALYLAIVWLGRVQDVALQAEHQASHLAFLGAHGDASWTNNRTPTETAPTATLAHLPSAPPVAQPAGLANHAAALRRDWGVADSGVLQALVRVPASTQAASTSSGNTANTGTQATPTLQAFQFPTGLMVARRATTLSGTGHASSDTHVQQRMANAALPWAQAATVSQELVQQVTDRMMPVDQAWGRAAPDGEWLSRWQGQVPPWHLGTRENLP